jgi:hypothetical protein
MSKKGSSPTIYSFLLSMDYGICHGPLQSINEIVVKEKVAFGGIISENAQIIIDEGDLFGGDEGEGGMKGVAEYFLGGPDQTMSPQLAARYNALPSEVPGYRGLAHIFFRGESDVSIGTEETVNPDYLGGGSFKAMLFNTIVDLLAIAPAGFGFNWTSNNPYLPAPSVHVTCSWGSLGSDPMIYPIIGREEGSFVIATPSDHFVDGKLDRATMPDMNPAYMLYELMVNSDWGKNESPSAMFTDSYLEAAAVLKSENFGLSMMFMEQDSISGFAQEILDHIKGAQYQNPSTGLWTLTLFRDNYGDIDLLDTVDPSNANVTSIRTRAWNEVINHVRVVYTDPTSEENESVAAQMPSVIALQNGVVSETREYYGIRNRWLAKTVAQRDVAEASRILTVAKIEMNRDGFDKVPGQVVKFVWPDENIEKMGMRITSVDWGSSTDRKISLELTEDIHSSPTMEYVEDQGAEFISNDGVLDNPDQVLVMGIPLPLLNSNGITTDESDAAYPQTGAMFLVNDSDMSMVQIRAYADVVQSNGSAVVSQIASFSPSPTSSIGVALIPEVSSILSAGLIESLVRGLADVGSMFVLGTGANDHEIIMLDSLDAVAGEWTVTRGVWDTLPRTWAVDDRIWRISDDLTATDSREIFIDEAAAYFFLPRTSGGSLALADSTQVDYIAQNRQHAPFRPANCQIGGQGFGGLQYTSGTTPATITCTWSTRNRGGEDVIVSAWDAGSSTPEVGQTTTIRIRDSITGTIEIEYVDIAGATFDIVTDDLQLYQFYDVEFVSVRDSIESFMFASRPLEIQRLGYGNNMGYDYGENDGG